MALDLSQRYPQNRMFLWATADCYFALGDYEKALFYYQRVLAATEGKPYDNRFNDVLCRWKMANCYFRQKEYKKTIAECQAISVYSLRSDIAERLREKLEQVGELKMKAAGELQK